jgi:myo-inositol-1(or 4)-monophosphatase
MEYVDSVAENAIVRTLKRHTISFTLISEESGIREYGSDPSRSYVVIDPIDGSTNFMRGIPFYATSIAVSTEPMMSGVFAALVADLFHDDAYFARRGKGAYRNEERIVSRKHFQLDEAMIGIDINTLKTNELLPKLTKLLMKTRHVRHLGANALELCYVARGTIDAFVDLRGRLRTTDIAGASLILREAGGRMTTPDGRPLEAKLDPKERVSFVAAADQSLHESILELL